MKFTLLPVVAASFAAWLCGGCKKPEAAKSAGDGELPIERMHDVIEDLFRPMDGGIELSGDEISGRNMWMLWTAGSEHFWDRMARESHGLVDLLKTLDSRQRGRRFQETGLINEPGFRAATKPDEFGLWLDERVEKEPDSYDPEVYGRSSGVLGFRLFRNPAFDAAARAAWDAQRYETDAAYAADPRLVRPYRIGVTCAACHAGFNPQNPPGDPESPRWENLSSVIGNQYLREGAVFARGARAGGFFAEMLRAQPRGTSDTTRIASDNLNNPSAISPILSLTARIDHGKNEWMHPDFLLLHNQRAQMIIPRLQIDASDNVGFPGALLRPYVNIGLHSQHWLEQINPLVGLVPTRPFSIKAGRKSSAYWNSTEGRAANLLRFLQKMRPLRLADAPGGRGFIDAAKVPRGAVVFAQRCAGCHSGRQPPEGLDIVEWFQREMEKPEFLRDNSFANEERYPITQIQTNASRALATNHKRGEVWHAFSSEMYKTLGSVGEIDVWNPATGKEEKFRVPEGGTGFYRPPSLVSLWATAPFLHNNSVGKYTGDPSVRGRLDAYHDAMEKLLWPEKRAGLASVHRTAAPSTLQLHVTAIPEPLHSLLAPHADPDGWFRVGPIPAGMPINLFANVDPALPTRPLAETILAVKRALAEAAAKNLDAAALEELMKKEVLPALFKASKSPDLIEDRGHTFGADLPDADKQALIEFLKTI
jgi:mono/diheme cytochrome c family protein